MPFVQHQELINIKSLIKDKQVSIIFDGTTYVCEALVILVRFVDENFSIRQLVVRLKLLAKSLTGEELAHQLIVCLSTELGVGPNTLLACMRDRASVNSVAVRTLKIVYPKIFDIGCFSHTLDHVGEHMHTPVLDEFMKGWIGLFSRSPKTKLAWQTLVGLSPPSYSTTRWWSKKHIHDLFGDVPSFLDSDDLAPTKIKLQEILSDPAKNRKLRIELAVIIDVGEAFVKATYRLEGDGPLVFTAYEEISTLQAAISAMHYPNTNAIARKLASNSTQLQQLIDYAKACAKPAYDYFSAKFGNDLKEIVTVFKYARYFDPTKINELKPISGDIDNLRVLPFLDNNTIIYGLKCELPLYMAKADGLSVEADKMDWWKKHEAELPLWSTSCKSVLLLQPSSAAAERVFSLLANSFCEQQTRALEDYVQSSVMLQYNYRS